MKGRLRVIRGELWAERLKEQLALPPMDAAQWMEQHTQIMKSGPYSLSGLLTIDDEVCFLKLYRTKTPLHKILFALAMGYPLRNFSVARALAADGLAVPAPLACVLVSQGLFLLTEGLPGDGNLAELWRRQPSDDRASRVMQSAGETLATLHSSGYAHGDCKWDNLFWSGQRVYLANLDKGRKSAPGSIEQARDLARFTVDAEVMKIGPRMYEQFLQTYLQGVGETRREAVGRLLPHLYRFRTQHLASYGTRGQRLV